MAAFLWPVQATGEASTPQTCGGHWSIPWIKLKDHTFFEYEGYHYFLATSLPLRGNDGRDGKTLAYARTQDFCTWENLGYILERGPAASADDTDIWAPHVIAEGGTYFLYYTGVNRNVAQSIMLATSSNPADPLSWQKQGVVFRPDHPGMVYPGPDQWSDARDPMVREHEGRYYLYYTGRDVMGSIVGVAMASSPWGPWRDLGATVLDDLYSMQESPYVLYHGGYYYLFTNRSGANGAGAEWRWAPSPFGPWQPPVPEPLGWAHDFALVGPGWHVSYLLGDGVAIKAGPLRWLSDSPPVPAIGALTFLPAVSNSGTGEPTPTPTPSPTPTPTPEPEEEEED